MDYVARISNEALNSYSNAIKTFKIVKLNSGNWESVYCVKSEKDSGKDLGVCKKGDGKGIGMVKRRGGEKRQEEGLPSPVDFKVQFVSFLFEMG